MSVNKTPKLVRNIELLSLIISVAGWPFLSILGGIGVLFVAQNTFSPILAGIFGLFIILFGLLWNTNHAPGGFMFFQPFKHYLNHVESADDRFYAYTSFLSSILIILIVLILLTHISDF